MTKRFSRQELYDLVWSEPMRDLAKKYDISDRGLAKACEHADIPVPERGYWNKLQAGKKVTKAALPPRGLAKSDQVVIGGSSWYNDWPSNQEILDNPIPPPPVFLEDMTSVRKRVEKLVRKAPLPKDLNVSYPLSGRPRNEFLFQALAFQMGSSYVNKKQNSRSESRRS